MGKDYPEKTSFSWYLPSMQPTGTSKAEAQCLTTPLPLTKFLGQKLPICQLLDLDPEGVWVSTRGGIWLQSQRPSTRIYGDYQLIIAMNSSFSVNIRTRSAAECHP